MHDGLYCKLNLRLVEQLTYLSPKLLVIILTTMSFLSQWFLTLLPEDADVDADTRSLF